MNAILEEPVESKVDTVLSDPEGDAVVKRDLSILGHVPVRLEVVVGQAVTSVEDLFALKAGNTLVLDAELDAPVALRLNGKTIARGHLMAVEDHFGFRVTEIA